MRQSYLILTNIRCKKNIQNIIKSCIIFGVTEIFVIGKKKLDDIILKNMDKFITFTRLNSLKECQIMLLKRHISIIGIEILPCAKNIMNENVFNHFKYSSIAFMLGNEGNGLNKNQINICEDFIYIPQFGNGTASLNVSVAASIILNEFASYADFSKNKNIVQN